MYKSLFIRDVTFTSPSLVIRRQLRHHERTEKMSINRIIHQNWKAWTPESQIIILDISLIADKCDIFLICLLFWRTPPGWALLTRMKQTLWGVICFKGGWQSAWPVCDESHPNIIRRISSMWPLQETPRMQMQICGLGRVEQKFWFYIFLWIQISWGKFQHFNLISHS